MLASGRLSKWGLRSFALGYLALLLLIPLGMIFFRAFEHGLGTAFDSVTTRDSLHAFYLRLRVTAIGVPLTRICGVGCALVLVRTESRGKALINAIIDLPFAISPV